MSDELACRVKDLGLADYSEVWQAMLEFTNARDESTPDELWLVEHPPVFTQGQAGKPEHVLDLGDIPLVQTDRGGQVTYHGPGQLVVYPLLDIKRLKLGARALVTAIEQSVVTFAEEFGLEAAARPYAPGVYVSGRKLASLGLRIRKGKSFHGVAVNIHADLTPFQRINPCGYPGMEMVNLSDLVSPSPTMSEAKSRFSQILLHTLGLCPSDDPCRLGESLQAFSS